MSRVLRSRISYANVMSTLAVFLALGGGAWAVGRPATRGSSRSTTARGGDVHLASHGGLYTLDLSGSKGIKLAGSGSQITINKDGMTFQHGAASVKFIPGALLLNFGTSDISIAAKHLDLFGGERLRATTGSAGDMTLDVKHDLTTSVGHDATSAVGHDSNSTLGNDFTSTINGHDTAFVGQSKSETIAGSNTMTIHGNSILNAVGGDLTTTANNITTSGDSITTSADRDMNLSAAGNMTDNAGKAMSYTAGTDLTTTANNLTTTAHGNSTMSVGGNLATTIGGDVTLDARNITNTATNMTNKVIGDLLNQAAVTLTDKSDGDVNVLAKGALNLKGAVINTN